MHPDDMFAATRSGNIETIETALTRDPALLHARDDKGATPLHYAALAGHREVVRLLVARGAEVNAVDAEFGATPAGWAIEYLREQGGLLAIEIEDLVFAIQQADVQWATRLVTRHPSLRTQVDSHGVSMREHADRSGSERIVALFM